MSLYRISIYDSASVWGSMIHREYTYFTDEKEARERALSLCVKPDYHYTVCKVKCFGE